MNFFRKKSFHFSGISYMQALFKVQIAQQNVRVDIRKGRTDLLVYIDDVEQDQGQNLCEFIFKIREIFFSEKISMVL